MGDAGGGGAMGGPNQNQAGGPNHEEMELRAMAELQEHVLAAQQCEFAHCYGVKGY
jgi:hypothetical protein